MGQYLKAVQEPIWDNLFRQKAELFREVEQIYWGHSAELERLGSWGVGDGVGLEDKENAMFDNHWSTFLGSKQTN